MAAVLSMLAGVIHLWVTPAHRAEWWGHGLFFAVVAALQILYGGLWLSLDFDRARLRVLSIVGIVAHLLLLGRYVLTRRLGIPVIGPHAGETEPVGAVDLASKAVELVLTVMLLSLVRATGHGPVNRSAASS